MSFIETDSTSTDTFVDAHIAGTDCDGRPARVELTVSVGEFVGCLIGLSVPLNYENVQIDKAGLIALIENAQTALKVMEAHNMA
jgi:hypothetical protein